METLPEKNRTLMKVVLRSLRIPLFFLLIGLALISLAWFDVEKGNPMWLQAINVASQFGDILVIWSFVFFAYRVSSSIVDRYRQFLIQKNYQTTAKVFLIINKGLKIIFTLIAMNVVVSVFDFERHYLDAMNKIIYVIMIMAVAWVLLQVISIVEEILYRKFTATLTPGAKRSSMSYTKFHIMKNIAAMIIIVIAVAAALMVFDKVRNIGISLLASAGFLTAVFALAAQKTLSSLFVGLQLVLAQTVEIGDVVVIENESGLIEEITLTYVVVKMSDLRRWILPINYFIEKPFQNWSRSLEGLSGGVRIFVDYVFPVELLRTELKKILANNILWDGRVASVAVSDLRENNVELKIMVSAGNVTNLDALRNEVREGLLVFIRETYPESLPRTRTIAV